MSSINMKWGQCRGHTPTAPCPYKTIPITSLKRKQESGKYNMY